MAKSSALKGFRYGVKFGEKLFRNILSQSKWTTRQGKLVHTWTNSLHLRYKGSNMHPALSILAGLIITFIGFHLFLLLCVWAVLKSI